MAKLFFDNIAIAGLACAVPSFSQAINSDPGHHAAEYIKGVKRQTGVARRHISLTEQTVTDLGTAALVKALERAAWDKDSLDGIVFMSQMPDFNPGTGNAFVLHNQFGLHKDVLAFDITLGCSSFPYGLSVCGGLLQQPDIKRIAMISGDNAWPDYPSVQGIIDAPVFLFGEGTTALLLEKRPSPPIHITLHSDGSGYSSLFNPFVGSRNAWRKYSRGRLSNGKEFDNFLAFGNYMDGMEIASFSMTTVVDFIREFLEWQGKKATDYDALLLHQANLQMMKSIARQLGVGMEKMPVSLDRYANTSGASILLTMADAYGGRQDEYKEPLSLLGCTFGIGLSWGVIDFQLDPGVVAPIFESGWRSEEGFLHEIE
ncbi:putative 3-oxoacyl-(acyl-carrier-protein) synthase 3 [uncultured delta proteobacterium]|uniref:Putative 3-oxoacyl-(Acyl-carrier-protein) synthase 3 n=1 Tax=uncultured delta proteobacterium TaxID=34034 RepID=A0A212JWL8_9DELT|nr:putative 3-oxoacyl-(acyl-carrier-protein) synthase 3 [uncultured delta proteobacterium]